MREISRWKPVMKNRTTPANEAAVVEFAIEQPAYGQVRGGRMLAERGVSMSPADVRCVCQWDDLKTMDQEKARTEPGSAW